MSTFDEANAAVKQLINEEVEKRVEAWIINAKGIDFATNFQEIARENAELRQKAGKLQVLLVVLLKRVKAVTDQRGDSGTGGKQLGFALEALAVRKSSIEAELREMGIE